MIKTPNATEFTISENQVQYAKERLMRHATIHIGVKCQICSLEYAAYWTGNKFQMRDKDTAECKCGTTILSWNETEGLALLDLKI